MMQGGKFNFNYYEPDLLLFSASISEVSDDLLEVMEIAHQFENYGMQEKIDALNRITIINHRRLISDDKERILNKQ